MTTSSTILADNPTMLHKKKIVLDRCLKTDLNSKIYQQGEIYLFCDKKTCHYEERACERRSNLIQIQQHCDASLRFARNDKFKIIKTKVLNDKLDLDFVLKKAYELGIKSILIEAGGHLNGEALKYADKIYHFIAPKITGDNSSLSCFDYRKITDINECENFEIKSVEKFGQDILLIYSRI